MSKRFLLIFCILILTISLVACFDKQEENKPSIETPPTTEIVPTTEDEVIEVYGNGTGVVNYKGDIYYIEHGGNDYATDSIRGAIYGLNIYSNTQRYLNKIDARSNITNLFKLTASTEFNIIDDRFYLASNNGQIYTVNMNGEDTIELAKGYYVAFDYPGHAVYYQNEDNPKVLFKVDTKTMSINSFDFENPTMLSNYNLITARNGFLYYSLLDSKNKKLVIVEFDVANNKSTEIAETTINMDLLEEDIVTSYSIGYALVSTLTAGDYAVISIGDPCTGTLGGYYSGIGYLFDIQNKKISVAFDYTNISEGDNYWDSSFIEASEKVLYKYTYNNEMYPVDSFFTEQDRKEFAQKYNIDLDAKIGDEAKNSASITPDYPKYIIEMEDHYVVGDKVLYKVTASRYNPMEEIGWRPAFIRIATEVYLKDLTTGSDALIYSYVNEKYEEQVSDILKELDKENSNEAIEGLEVPDINNLKDDEMKLVINVESIWKTEFDIKVEEEGGTIFGKRVEYEGHHKKEDGNITLVVNKEVGAMLKVFVDSDLHSQVLIDESM